MKHTHTEFVNYNWALHGPYQDVATGAWWPSNLIWFSFSRLWYCYPCESIPQVIKKRGWLFCSEQDRGHPKFK